MAIFERFVLTLIGIALIGSVLMGIAMFYHFSRFSPDKKISTITMTVYSSGLIVIVMFVLLFLTFR